MQATFLMTWSTFYTRIPMFSSTWWLHRRPRGRTSNRASLFMGYKEHQRIRENRGFSQRITSKETLACQTAYPETFMGRVGRNKSRSLCHNFSIRNQHCLQYQMKNHNIKFNITVQLTNQAKYRWNGRRSFWVKRSKWISLQTLKNKRDSWVASI